jgi:hypothetical protein
LTEMDSYTVCERNMTYHRRSNSAVITLFLKINKNFMYKMRKEAIPVSKHQALKRNVIDEAESMFLKAELVNQLGLRN